MNEQEPDIARRNDGSHRIRRLLVRLVEELVAEGSLQVVPGTEPAGLAEELHTAIARAGGFAQLGGALSKALLASAMVEEFYLDELELARRVGALGAPS
jgi:hypothetical protein